MKGYKVNVNSGKIETFQKGEEWFDKDYKRVDESKVARTKSGKQKIKKFEDRKNTASFAISIGFEELAEFKKIVMQLKMETGFTKLTTSQVLKSFLYSSVLALDKDMAKVIPKEYKPGGHYHIDHLFFSTKIRQEKEREIEYYNTNLNKLPTDEQIEKLLDEIDEI